MITVYGIPNCDTIKKARQWLESSKIDYQFHDYRKNGINRDMVAAWVAEHGFETILNRRGTTWRGLSDEEKQGITPERAIDLMVSHPAMIKRPIFDLGSERLVGFTADVQARLVTRE